MHTHTHTHSKNQYVNEQSVTMSIRFIFMSSYVIRSILFEQRENGKLLLESRMAIARQCLNLMMEIQFTGE